MQGCTGKQVRGSVAAGGARWRRALRRELTGLLLVKFAALGLLWWLFFVPAHRSPVDAHAASRQFGVAPRTAQPAAGHTPLNRGDVRD